MSPTGSVKGGRDVERQQAASRWLLEKQEEERRKIARELHDDVGQSLALLKLILDKALSTTRSRSASSSLLEAKAIVADLVKRVRELALELRPSMLDDLGLLPALLWRFEQYTAETHVQVNFRHSGLERDFPVAVRTAAYRIAEEAMAEAARSGGDKEVIVHSWADDEAVHLEVEGGGGSGGSGATVFDGSSGSLDSMRAHAELVGGRLLSESTPGGGTRVTAEIPL